MQMSGKQARRARQQAVTAPPPVARKGAGGRRSASPKVLVIAAVAGLVIAAVIVGIALAVGGNSSPSSSSTTPAIGSLKNALPFAETVQREFKGIPQHGLVLGSPKAPLTMVQYIDLQCPACRAYETSVQPSIVQEFVRTGKLKIEARPIAFIGPDSIPARKAMIAASNQNRAFNFAQITYANQGTENTGWLNDTFIQHAAASVPGMDVRALLDDQNSTLVTNATHRIDAQANADKLSETPTLLIGKTGSKLKKVSSSAPFNAAELAAAIRGLG
jgi:protein-disulfide isomerase